MNKEELVTHCFNCTGRDNSKLPEKYQGIKITSIRGVNLCPRCKCPEVAYLDESYTTSNGYNDADYAKK